MTTLEYRAKVDLGVAAVTIAVGGFFTYQVSLIESLAEDAIGPRMIPYFLSIAIVVLGVLIGASALYFNASEADGSRDLSVEELAAREAGESFGFRNSDLAKISAVVVMGFIYIGLFWALGYFISTLLSLALMLLVFGNRAPRTVLILAIAGALAYDYLFMGLMGLYDPAGEYFDLSRFLEEPSFKELTRKLPF
jgi:hypothetical protein